MKILACFKIVPDLDLVAEEDWKADKELQVDTGYVRPIWNCFDESALEMMLKLSDLSEGFDVVYELNALTVGKKKDESFLKILYALGYSHGIRIEKEDGCLFSPELVSSAVAAYMKRYAMQDVVVMGRQSSDGSNMKTPYLLAEKMRWPCIRDVVKMEPVDELFLKVTSSTGHGRLVQVIKTPCVLVVGNAQDSYLRVPTLKDKMRLGKRPAELVRLEDLELDSEADSQIQLISLETVSAKRDTVWLDGDSPREKAQKLYETYLQGRLANEISSDN